MEGIPTHALVIRLLNWCVPVLFVVFKGTQRNTTIIWGGLKIETPASDLPGIVPSDALGEFAKSKSWGPGPIIFNPRRRLCFPRKT